MIHFVFYCFYICYVTASFLKSHRCNGILLLSVRKHIKWSLENIMKNITLRHTLLSDRELISLYFLMFIFLPLQQPLCFQAVLMCMCATIIWTYLKNALMEFLKMCTLCNVQLDSVMNWLDSGGQKSLSPHKTRFWPQLKNLYANYDKNVSQDNMKHFSGQYSAP